MMCQDCGEKEADTIIYSDGFFAVCVDCIKDDDEVCPDELIVGVKD